MTPTHLLLVTALAALSMPLAAQANWTMLNPGTTPSARNSTAMVWDHARNRAVMYGGFGGGSKNDTWEWVGNDWVNANPATSAGIRNGHAMAYDRGRSVTVMFGGAASGSVGLGDTWEWNGATWTRRSTSGPPGRVNHQMCFDKARGVTVLFGGHLDYNNGPNVNDTWEWSGTAWRQVTPAASPSARAYHAMAYDEARQRTVLFGGRSTTYLNDTWEYDGTTWTQLSPPVSPPARIDHEMVYDAARGRVLIFSGFGGPRDTWEFDGSTWVSIATAQSPSQRYAYGFAFDADAGRVLLFGGYAGGQDSETWMYRSNRPARFSTFGAGCAGAAGVPATRAATGSLPWIGDTFTVLFGNLPLGRAAIGLLGASNTTWFVTPLPFALGVIGMPGCNLLVSPDITATLPNPAGTAHWSIPLPNVPSLTGSKFYVQAVTLSPGSNALGVVVSDGGDATIGVR